MQGYGRDESAPTPGGMFVGCFVGECVYFAECSLGYFVGVGWVFTECSQRVRYLYVTYSQNKSMVFSVQKGGFWRAKRGFLHYKSMVFVF